MNNTNSIKNYFSISQSQETKIQKLIEELIVYNKHTNIVGKSTLVNPWKSHILDCIQITPFIEIKKKTGFVVSKEKKEIYFTVSFLNKKSLQKLSSIIKKY